ncbi:MAG: zinc ribbon domain-containing protein [Anaerolineae bacterium]
MLCPNCGAEIAGEGESCPFCGSRPARAAGPPAARAAGPPAESPSGVARCSQCGHTNLSGDAFCVLCGAPLGGAEGASEPAVPEPLSCGQCGRENLPGSAFCVGCGAPLDGAASGAPVPVSSAPAAFATPAEPAAGAQSAAGDARQPRRKRRGCCLVLAIVGAALLIALVAFANLVARELNRVESGNGLRASTPAAVPSPTRIAAPTPVPVDGAAAPLLDTGRAVAAVSQEVGAQGGALAVLDLTSPLYGLEVQVPAGALGTGDRAMLQASVLPEPPDIGPADMLAEDPTLFDTLDALVASPPDPVLVYHPIWQAPAMLSGEWDLVSPLVILEPAGYTFRQPVRVTLPLEPEAVAAIQDPLDLLVMGRSEVDGVVNWEVVRNWSLDPQAGTVTFETTHFSGWGAWLWRKTGNALYAGYLHSFGAAELLNLQSQLPQDTLKNLVKAMVCSPKALYVDMSRAPDRFDALMFLGWGHGGSLGGGLHPDYIAMEKRLGDWLLNMSPRNNKTGTGTRAPGTVGVEEVFAHALEIADGDVFAAVLTSHSVMRLNQKRGAVQDLMRPYRPDGGDQAGAYYHLFGAAMYSFLQEHNKSTGWVEAFTPADLEGIARGWSPEMAVLFEETIFASEGGDIRGDTMEYAVDRQGVAIGSALFQMVRGMNTDQMARAYGIDRQRDCTPAQSAAAVPVPPATAVPTARAARPVVAGGGLAAAKPDGTLAIIGAYDLIANYQMVDNDLTLRFDLNGGPVTGDGEFVVSSVAGYTMQEQMRAKYTFSGTYDAAARAFAGTGETNAVEYRYGADGSVTENRAAQLFSWTATLAGNTISGTMNGNGQGVPFILTFASP